MQEKKQVTGRAVPREGRIDGRNERARHHEVVRGVPEHHVRLREEVLRGVDGAEVRLDLEHRRPASCDVRVSQRHVLRRHELELQVEADVGRSGPAAPGEPERAKARGVENLGVGIRPIEEDAGERRVEVVVRREEVAREVVVDAPPHFVHDEVGLLNRMYWCAIVPAPELEMPGS